MKAKSYQKAGVSLEKGQSFVQEIQKALENTHSRAYPPLKSSMNFASLVDLSSLKDMDHPVLVSSTDGVGTKLHLAHLFDYHDTVGIDLVAMCVNDILCSGAIPFQFLDYISCEKLDSKRMKNIIASIASGCKKAGCTLAGGETAEHPKILSPHQYDLAGFAIGVVDKKNLIDGSSITQGDSIIGIPSSGVHSNGLSLIRYLFLKDSLDLPNSEDDCHFLLEEILKKPTLIYEPILRPLLKRRQIEGLAHITGGGFFENIPRILPQGLSALIHKDAWNIPEVFSKIQSRGGCDSEEMFHTFNMGIGMVAITKKQHSNDCIQILKTLLKQEYPSVDTSPSLIGEVRNSSLLEGESVVFV